jgi:hypothetical protein
VPAGDVRRDERERRAQRFRAGRQARRRNDVSDAGAVRRVQHGLQRFRTGVGVLHHARSPSRLHGIVRPASRARGSFHEPLCEHDRPALCRAVRARPGRQPRRVHGRLRRVRDGRRFLRHAARREQRRRNRLHVPERRVGVSIRAEQRAVRDHPDRARNRRPRARCVPPAALEPHRVSRRRDQARDGDEILVYRPAGVAGVPRDAA